jgi:hypothetical protein
LGAPDRFLRGSNLGWHGGAFSPFWSPDSRFIAFFADGKLKKIDASGGTEGTWVGSWGRDGTILFNHRSTDFSGIYRVADTGGEQC